MVEDLLLFHSLEEAIPNLKKELSTYLAFADGVAEVSLVDWWMRHEQKLPCWAESCQKVCCASHPWQLLKELFSKEHSVFYKLILGN